MIDKVEARRATQLKAAAPPKRRRADRKLPEHEQGMSLQRYFTEAGVDPYDQLEWDLRTASISSESGKTVFEQKDVEVPKPWSMLATNVVVQKYFRGALGTPARERSVRQLISRVVDT